MQGKITNHHKLVRVLDLFREFLTESWPTLQTILQNHDWDEDPYFLDEWLDLNWSLLVGRQLLGKGADIQPLCAASIDIRKGKYPIHIRVDAPIVGTFVSIGSCENGFSLAPPFDTIKILRDDGIKALVPFSIVSLRLSV
jgi:hypothetical protein